MRNRAVSIILFLSCSVFIFSEGNPWGHLKKIYFYNSAQKNSKVLENLNSINLEDVKRTERREIVKRLIGFGDYYFSKGDKDLAEVFYKKVVDLSPEYWYVYNRLEKIDRSRGDMFINFKNVFRQFVMTLKDFESSLLVFNSFINVLFFSVLLSLFIFSFILFIRYFKLAGNDLLIDSKGRLSLKKALLLFLVILWPVLMLSGWMIYPFLITSFLWVYLNNNEKKTLSFMLILIVVISIFYSLNAAFEKNVESENFKMIQKLSDGYLFKREDYEKFDDELKVIQAFAYYEGKQYEMALEILNSTEDEYKSVLKYDLLGNIFLKSGNIPESIKYYKESLNLDEKNDITMSNFTLALLRNQNQKVFDSWAKRYPAINTYKNTDLKLKEVRTIPGSILWRRLFNFSKEKFALSQFFKNVFVEFYKLPTIYYVVLFILYILMNGRLWPRLGESTYCGKCSKIIKEKAVPRSYKLCDECHQLFLIKDVIFLEAKVLKEKELRRKFKKKYAFSLLFSLLIPGLNLKYREKDTLFVVFSMVFYILLGFSVIGMIVFNKIFLTSPTFLNLIGAAALLLYFLVNILSILGEEDGI